MIKPIILTSRAKKDIYNTEEFYFGLYGVEKTQEIIILLLKHIKFLEGSIYDWYAIGSLDETFNHLKSPYRKIFQKHIKINYKVGVRAIYITVSLTHGKTQKRIFSPNQIRLPKTN